MANLSQGQSASLVLNPGDSYSISTTGTATVRGAYGAPTSTTTLTAQTQTFGPYGANAKLEIVAVSGSASYNILAPTGFSYEEERQVKALVSGAGNQVVALQSGMPADQVTARIQAALDGGNRRVTVSGSGTFQLSDRLYVDDNTQLVIGQGCALIGPAALYHPTRMMGLIVNRNMLAARTPVTVTASGLIATVNYPEPHGKAVGDPVMLLESQTRNYNGVWLVASVPTANSLTVRLGAVPEASPAVPVSWSASVLACAANKFISVQIDGVLDGNGANQPTPGSGLTDRYLGGVFLSGVYRPVVGGSGLINECKGYSVLIAGAAQPVVWGINIYSTLRDGVHLQGPIRGGLVDRPVGYAHDDFVSLTTGDLESLELTEGEFEGVEIVRPVCGTGATGSAVAFFGKTAWWFAGIKINGAEYKGDNSPVMLKGGGAAAQYTLDGQVFLDQLVVRDVSWENATRASAAASIVYISADPVLPDLLIENPTLLGVGGTNHGRFLSLARTNRDWSFGTITVTGAKNYSQGSASDLMYGAAGITGGKFVVKDCPMFIANNKAAFNLGGMTLRELVLDNAAGELGGSGSYVANLTSGTVDYVTVANNSPKTPANAGNLVYSNGALIRSVHLLNNNFTGGVLLVGDTSMSVANGHHVKLTGNTIVNGNKALVLNKGCRITSNNNVEIGNSQAVYDLRGAGQTYNVFEGSNVSERNADTPYNGTPFVFAGGATANLYAPQRRVHVDTAGINRVEGGALYNTNAAAGTLATVGPVTCLGTAAGSWKKVGNYALTY